MDVAGSLRIAEECVAPDEEAVASEFIQFLKEVSLRRHPDDVMLRFNQPRHAGCVEARFIVPNVLPAELRVGLFSHARIYNAQVRLASASTTTDRDKDIRGMAIKVGGVVGPNLTAGATTQDFVLNSHRVMLAPDTREFLRLLRAVEAGGLRRAWYFLTHVHAARIALAARQHHASHLDIPYWSATPYLFGEGRAVKYMVRPSSTRTRGLPDNLTHDYLRQAMKVHLGQTDATFDFMVQFQLDASRMPIEDAMVEWKERESPFVTVAHLHIPRQDFDTADRMALCETIAFNPWHCLPEHRPLGNMNRARQRIYDELARFRHERNAVA